MGTGLGLFFALLTSAIFWGVAVGIFFRAWCKASEQPDISWADLANRAKNILDIVFAETSNFHIYIKIVIFGLLVRWGVFVLAYAILALSGRTVTFEGLFGAFVQGDAYHYLNIAEFGYSWQDSLGRNKLLVFFPLYPFLVRIASAAVGSYLAASYLISVAAYCAGLVYLYRLARLDYSVKTAWWTVALVSIFPHSFFFGTPYTESLFLLTSTMTLYYIRTHKWFLVGIAGALVASTRFVGIIFVIVAAAEIVMEYKLIKRTKTEGFAQALRIFGSKGIWLLLMFAGIGVYFFLNWQVSGNPFMFLHYQEHYWSNTFKYFGETMITQFRNVANPYQFGRVTTFAPNIVALAFAIIMLLYAYTKKANITHIVYTLGYIFVAFSPAWLLSGGRYLSACATLFIFLGHFVIENPKARIAVPIIFFAGLLFFMEGFITGGAVF